MGRFSAREGIAMLAVAAAAVTGCNREPAEPLDQTALMETRGLDDETLATYVQSRFYADDQIRGNAIDVTAENGVVTLRGTVQNPEARQHAVQVARQVEGVTNVNDQLTVAATAPADATAANQQPGATRQPADRTAAADPMDDRSPGWITTKIQSQYFLNPEIKPWNIEVNTSQEGVVTLRGEVDDQADKQEAGRIARETVGVTGVTNELRVRGEAATAESAAREPGAAAGADAERAGIERPDPWITAKIQSKYFMDGDVKGRDINVDTNEGVVTLEGQVASEAERRQAVTLARNTEGVRSVTDNLRVQPQTGQTGDAGRQQVSREPATGAGGAIEDAWITTKIQSKYFLDSEVKGLDINVDTNNGVVTLKGTVDSEAARKAAMAIAQETEGVTRVNNQLKVETARPQQ